MNKIVKWVGGTLAAIVGTLELLAFAPAKTHEVIGWGDFNGDGTPDAIVVQSAQFDGAKLELGYIDGNKLEFGRDRTGKIEVESKHLMTPFWNVPLYRRMQGRVNLAARGVDNSGRTRFNNGRMIHTNNLEVYHSVDVEPASNCDIYKDVVPQ